jgi:hypothetical protein
VGVPEIAPVVAASDRPAGSWPAEIDQVNDGVPPERKTEAEYLTPVVPLLRVEVVILSIAPETLTV